METLEKKKLSIISFSGDFDKLVAAFTLASGSAALNYCEMSMHILGITRDDFIPEIKN